MTTKTEQTKAKQDPHMGTRKTYSNTMVIANCITFGIGMLVIFFVGPHIQEFFGYKSTNQYLKLDRMDFNEPPREHCSTESHQGRLAFTNNGTLFLCSGSPQGWHKLAIQQ